MRVLRIALLLVFGLGVLGIGWSYVDSGEVSLDQVRSLFSGPPTLDVHLK